MGADGEKYKDYGDNTFQQYLPDGTFGSYICGGEDQTVGTADDRSDVVVIDPPNQSYGSKFLPAENGAYWSIGLDGLLGTADDIKVWGRSVADCDRQFPGYHAHNGRRRKRNER